MILWDQVQPSDDWIDVQIPAVVKAAYNRMREAVKNAGDFSSKEPDSATAEASTSPPIDEAVDRQAVRQIYVSRKEATIADGNPIGDLLFNVLSCLGTCCCRGVLWNGAALRWDWRQTRFSSNF